MLSLLLLISQPPVPRVLTKRQREGRAFDIIAQKALNDFTDMHETRGTLVLTCPEARVPEQRIRPSYN